MTSVLESQRDDRPGRPSGRRKRRRVDGLTIADAICEAEIERNNLPLAHGIADAAVRATITQKEWQAIADWLAATGKTRMAGNPYSIPDVEVREAARWVDEDKKRWRAEHSKKRVKPCITRDFFNAAIARIAEQRGVPIPEESGEHANWVRWIAVALKARRLAHTPIIDVP